MRGQLSAGIVSLVLAAAVLPSSPLEAEDTSLERFLFVESWAGRLTITGTGEGELPTIGGTTTYTVQRHLDYSFTLSTFLAGTWSTCNTATSFGLIRDRVVTHFDSGCVTEWSVDASGPLMDVPPNPFPSPGAPECLVNGIQLQILPLSPTEAFTSWGYFDNIESTRTDDASCGIEFAWPSTDGILSSSLPPCEGGSYCLELPETGLRIVQVWSYDGTVANPGASNVPTHFEVVLELEACGDEPEVIVTAAGYDEWLPEGKDGEREEGNRLVLEATLQSKGGCPTALRARRFTFELLEVSSEPGVCMNYPTALGDPPSGFPDLGFLTARNPPPWLSSGDPSFILETEDGEFTKSPPAVLSSFDWGGTAALKVTAELLDGRTIVGHLAGDEAATRLSVPKRTGTSRVADAWKNARGVVDLADTDDAEALPVGDGHTGDGLTLYEEYRGFYEGNGREHVHGNPKKKDLFIIDEAGAKAGIALLASATKLEVHGNLRLGQLSPARLINANRSAQVTGASDQHGLIVLKRELGTSIRGQALGGPGLPRSVSRVYLSPTFGPQFVLALVPGGTSLLVNEKTAVTAHEILHATNVYHHGRGDRPSIDWMAASRAGGFDYTEDGRVVSLAEEGACGTRQRIEPEDATDHLTRVGVAAQGGQHSGHEDCVMRYNSAVYYEDTILGDSYWHHPRDETPGFIVCQSPGGTGVNAPEHCPQPRYGDATQGCCLYQICVNDRRDHEAGAGGTACPVGGGVGVELEGGTGGAEGDARPILSLAIDEGMTVVIRRGRPALITLEVASSRLGEAVAGEPLQLAAEGGWTSAIEFRLTANGAARTSWPIVPVGPTPNSIELDERNTALAAWWISPETTSAIEPGSYTLESILETTGTLGGWSGNSRAEPVSIEVSDEPNPLPESVATEKTLQFARYRVWEGRLDDALSLVDALLADDPGNATGHWFRAEILELRGEDAAALEAYRAALAADEAAEPDQDEVPTALLRAYADLLARMSGGTTTGNFRRGDANGDGSVNLSDSLLTLGYLFLGSEQPSCLDAADTDDDGGVNIGDAIGVLQWLFLGGSPPRAPGPFACGSDPIADDLDACSQAPCNPGR